MQPNLESSLERLLFQRAGLIIAAGRVDAAVGGRAVKEPDMSQAIVDPAELRRFAQQLSNFNTELEERLSALANQLHGLNNTWRDQEHKKFAEEFEQHLKLIARSMESSNEYIPFLLRKAERIEEYLQQR